MTTKAKTYPEATKRQAEAMYAAGMSLRQISEQIGCDHKTVSNWISKPEAQERIKEVEQDPEIRSALCDGALEAVAELRKQVRFSEQARERSNAADLLLKAYDRVKAAPKLPEVPEETATPLTRAEIQDLLRELPAGMLDAALTDKESTDDTGGAGEDG